MERDKRIYDKKFNDMQSSFANETDVLQDMISRQAKDLIIMAKENTVVNDKFNQYYSYCDQYMKD